VSDLGTGEGAAPNTVGGVEPAAGGGCVVVTDPGDVTAGLPLVVIGVGPHPHPVYDVVVPDGAGADEVRVAVEANPVPATALALLLRGGDRRTTHEGLVAESATYSALQAGADHRRWLAARPPRRERAAAGSPIRAERQGDVLAVTLDRPEVRNAFDATMRDALREVLAVAVHDPDVRVQLDGAGPSFCSGGDLDEFGTATDPAAAHLVRVAASVGAVLDAIADRVTATVHGACIGAGIELPAFAGRVVARPGATFGLPEVAMGLVPGAGGTVSIPRRIGRQRTAWLAITGRRLDARTALDWGLVDEIVDA
jgi:hypothetical protein